MFSKFIIILISVSALLIVCWMLTEYWLRSVRKFSREKISSLSIWNRMVFALEDFCEGVNHKKDFRKIRVEEELGSLHTKEGAEVRKMSERSKSEGKENGSLKKDKKYRMKANM